MFLTETFDGWSRLLEFCRRKSRGNNWVYRGQCDAKWDLRSRLERVGERFCMRDLEDVESELLREFKRGLHRYAFGLPEPEDASRWFALMQHHGAPTRLIDFTYSFYVSAYFAIERAALGDHCAVWAVNTKWCVERARLPRHICKRMELEKRGQKLPETFQAILRLKRTAVITNNPFVLNDRLAVQQGVFLMPLDLSQSFMVNLIGPDVSKEEAERNVVKMEICCSRSLMQEAMTDLNRMNVNRESLFPGIDGFATSLENRVLTRRIESLDLPG